jgi:hypothetical protein
MAEGQSSLTKVIESEEVRKYLCSRGVQLQRLDCIHSRCLNPMKCGHLHTMNPYQ